MRIKTLTPPLHPQALRILAPFQNSRKFGGLTLRPEGSIQQLEILIMR